MWTGRAVGIVETRTAYCKILVGKIKEKRRLRIGVGGGGCNINMALK
jgi:hypothetical protein